MMLLRERRPTCLYQLSKAPPSSDRLDTALPEIMKRNGCLLRGVEKVGLGEESL